MNVGLKNNNSSSADRKSINNDDISHDVISNNDDMSHDVISNNDDMSLYVISTHNLHCMPTKKFPCGNIFFIIEINY